MVCIRILGINWGSSFASPPVVSVSQVATGPACSVKKRTHKQTGGWRGPCGCIKWAGISDPDVTEQMDRQHLVSQRAPEKRNNTILVRCCSQQVEPRNAQGEEVVSCGRPPGEASKRWLSSRSAATGKLGEFDVPDTRETGQPEQAQKWARSQQRWASEGREEHRIVYKELIESCLPSEQMCSYNLCTPKALPKKKDLVRLSIGLG